MKHDSNGRKLYNIEINALKKFTFLLFYVIVKKYGANN